jgi:hypothetical protein
MKTTMKPLPSLALIPLSLLALGVGCASDQPRDEEADPTPAAQTAPDTSTSTSVAPPPSALHGAVFVWERVRDAADHGVRLGRLESRTVVGQDDQPDRVHVKLDLVVVGSDAIQATGRYVALLDELSVSPWCENVKRAPTRVLASGDALEVVGLEVLVQPSDSPWEAGRQDEDPERIASAIAGELGLGSLESRITTRQLARGLTETSYHLRPSDRVRAFELETVLAFALPLEERTADLSVTGIELKNNRRVRGAEPPDEWTFKLVLTARSEARE